MSTCDKCKKSTNKIYGCDQCSSVKLCDDCWNQEHTNNVNHIQYQYACRTDNFNKNNSILRFLK
jgi:hypothetical protein